MILRVARHTNNLEKIIEFYTKVLSLDVLGLFKDHAGYDGVFIGKNEFDWHLEFTSSTEKANHSFDEDDNLVFYPATEDSFQKIKENIKKQRVVTYKAKNPYWNDKGILIKDPDGFNIIISYSKISD